jgi:hypothetical protein
MENVSNRDQQSIKINSKSKTTSYRGFNSIDQEIEREIAMQWFTSSDKYNFSQRNFLLKKNS